MAPVGRSAARIGATARARGIAAHDEIARLPAAYRARGLELALQARGGELHVEGEASRRAAARA
jgi:hypothetical protein